MPRSTTTCSPVTPAATRPSGWAVSSTTATTSSSTGATAPWTAATRPRIINVINNYYKPGRRERQHASRHRADRTTRQYSPGHRLQAGRLVPGRAGATREVVRRGQPFRGLTRKSPPTTGTACADRKRSPASTPHSRAGRSTSRQRGGVRFGAGPGRCHPAPARRRRHPRHRIVRTGQVITQTASWKTPPRSAATRLTVSPRTTYPPTPTTTACRTRGRRPTLNSADAADASADNDEDGYTNVEEYLNGTHPREAIDYTNLGNNIDTLSG